MTNPTPHGQVPEALRLADELEIPIEGYPEATELERNAAAELRRLHAYCQELESQVIRDCMSTQQPAPAPMSPTNRLVAYSAATRLRELGFEWDATAEAWLQPAPATQPQAGAVPLTEQAIEAMWSDHWDGFVTFAEAEVVVRAIEEAHGIKGGKHD